MPPPILVTGGSGTLGRLVVSRLRDAGRDVRVLSRTSARLDPGTTVVTGDLMTGDGVELAVSGAETVVHCAGTAKDDDVKALTLTRAALAAQVRHLVFISVVGADRVPVSSRVDRAMFGYFAFKRAAEQAGHGSPLSPLMSGSPRGRIRRWPNRDPPRSPPAATSRPARPTGSAGVRSRRSSAPVRPRWRLRRHRCRPPKPTGLTVPQPRR